MKHPSKSVNDIPSGDVSIHLGLSHFKFQDMYGNDIHQYDGCIPFSDRCQIMVLLIVCLTKPKYYLSRDNSLEEDLINTFNKLSMDELSVSNYFISLSKNMTRRCETLRKEISPALNTQRNFFEDAEARNKERDYSFQFYKRAFYAGAIYKVDNSNVKFMQSCAGFQALVMPGQYKICYNLTKVRNYKSNEFLRHWAFWFKIDCRDPLRINSGGKDCSPSCVATDMNYCDNGIEKCYPNYRQIVVDAYYTLQNGSTILLVEKLCYFRDECNNSTCPGNKTCMTFESGKSQCMDMRMAIYKVTGKTRNVQTNTYLLEGDSIKCSHDPVGGSILIKNGILYYTSWEIIRSSIPIRKDTDLIHILQYNYINTNVSKELVLKVACRITFIYNYQKYYIFKDKFISDHNFTYHLLKKPTKIFVKGGSKYVHINQRVVCETDGIHSSAFNITYKVFNKLNEVMVMRDHIFVKLEAIPGRLYFYCGAILAEDPSNSDFVVDSNFTVIITHISNFNWGPERLVIYAPAVITCNKKIYMDHRTQIIQLEGTSTLEHIQDLSFRIKPMDLGGYYKVLCSITTTGSIKHFYHKFYHFNIYRIPNAACLVPIVGYDKVHIFCLDDGYPLDLGYRTITVDKYVMKVHSNTIIYNSDFVSIPFENKKTSYNLSCKRNYNGYFYTVNMEFSLLHNIGIKLLSKSMKNRTCSDEVKKVYMTNSENKFFLDTPVYGTFYQIQILFGYLVAAIAICIIFLLIHVYSFDKNVAKFLTVNSLCRRHCIMRLHNKMTELAIFRVKNSGSMQIDGLRDKLQKYKVDDTNADEREN